MASKRAFASILSIERAASSGLRSRTVCSSCRRQLQLKQSSAITTSSPPTRSLSSSPTLHKKSSASSKSSRKSPKVGSADVNEHIPDKKATRNRDDEIDPYDHSELEGSIAQAVARLKDALTKTRDAGRVTPDMLEALPVELNIKHPDQSKPKGKGETAHHERAKLGDIASVVPKGGRMLQVFAAEEGHVKPLTASIMASDYSLTPEVDKNNPMLILVPVPPATAETRQQAAQEAKKCFDKASLEVRNARGDAQKRFRRMELNKLVIQDELKKAHKGMEDVAKKGQDEVKKVFDNALKTLQQ
ncbi:ribosome-recycling factor [Knufia obscura]|uniref:Ribosome-recycling factor n=1 Tax=Knufia obscura TaxID=1635080 RepID=A0ABR0RJA8_9EURO|nr:ribosome-recycling factor [Knufia obscura]